MSYQQHSPSRLYALLIGINYYLPNALPHGSYQSLEGCVRDITEVETFLKSTLHLPDTQIVKLQSSRGKKGSRETREQWPTYENMVAAFHNITKMAQAGDQVYIHYSGHGGRAKTLFPELKGEQGFDEALVPMDIGRPTARYLRDVEIARILKTMVDKGLIVTIVLDSCHSGSATRGGQDRVRGLQTVDPTARPTQSLVATREDLVETWRDLSGGTSRGFMLGSGWLPEVKDYVLLAACRATESAYEHIFSGVGKHGVLTYWLLDALKQLTPGLTYKQLHDRIVAKVHSEFVLQTPQLQGDGGRVVFGLEHREPLYAVNVMRVKPAQKRLLLNTGQSQAIRQGAQFMVYSPGTTDFGRTNMRQALVEISELGATDSWARIVASFHPDPILQGAQAVLINPGSMRLCRTIRLVHQEHLPATIAQEKVLREIEQVIRHDRSNFVVVADSDDTTDFQVAITPQTKYEIWDPAGVPLANLRPAIHIEEKGAAEQLTRRLIHLAKYRNVLQLENADVLSPLAGKLMVELAGMQAEYDPADRPQPRPFRDPGHIPILKPGEWTFLRIKNAFSQVLNITVLDLGPDWSITQIYPSRRDTSAMTLDPGAELLIPLQAYLPGNYTDAVDVLKVFATIGSTSFRWLELPALDRPHISEGARGRPRNSLEQLLTVVAAEEAQTRHLNPAVYPTGEWITALVEIRVQQP
jgi:hypothetical protein